MPNYFSSKIPKFKVAYYFIGQNEFCHHIMTKGYKKFKKVFWEIKNKELQRKLTIAK